VINDPVNAKDLLGLEYDPVDCWSISFLNPTVFYVCESSNFVFPGREGRKDLRDGGDTRGGGGSPVPIQPPPSTTAEKRRARFLKQHSGCESAINVAAQEQGIAETISEIGTFYEPYSDPNSDSNRRLLSTSLTDLGFRPPNSTQLQYVIGEGGFVALTNPDTSKVYLGFTYTNSRNEDAKDLLIVHESLHLLFRTGHSEIANALGLRNNGKEFTGNDDAAASDAIDNWLAAGCP
jgi:hypothetical protein